MTQIGSMHLQKGIQVFQKISHGFLRFYLKTRTIYNEQISFLLLRFSAKYSWITFLLEICRCSCESFETLRFLVWAKVLKRCKRHFAATTETNRASKYFNFFFLNTCSLKYLKWKKFLLKFIKCGHFFEMNRSFHLNQVVILFCATVPPKFHTLLNYVYKNVLAFLVTWLILAPVCLLQCKIAFCVKTFCLVLRKFQKFEYQKKLP